MRKTQHTNQLCATVINDCKSKKTRTLGRGKGVLLVGGGLLELAGDTLAARLDLLDEALVAAARHFQVWV